MLRFLVGIRFEHRVVRSLWRYSRISPARVPAGFRLPDVASGAGLERFHPATLDRFVTDLFTIQGTTPSLPRNVLHDADPVVRNPHDAARRSRLPIHE